MSFKSANTYNYAYKEFTIFIRPTAFLKYEDPGWRPDRATPAEWGYRIDQIPGKLGIAGGSGYENSKAAEVAAQNEIDSWVNLNQAKTT